MSDNIPWYAEASLRARDHVFCAGSVAQCVRKWRRLPERERSTTYLKLTHAIDGRSQLDGDELAALANKVSVNTI
jgi:hypothetical protein